MTPESVDELFTVAWRAKPAVGALAKIVRPFVADLATARSLCEAWLPAPLEPGGPIPATLPTGEPLPASRNPWGREGSPLPGVDLPAQATLALAWRAIELEAQQRRMDDEPSTRPLIEALQGLVPGAKLTRKRASLLIVAWRIGGSCRCLRAAEPWPIATKQFDDEHVARLIASVTTPALGMQGWLDALRMLIRCGYRPAKAAELLAAWCPASGLVPTGEWVPPHLLPKASTMPLCPGGVYLGEAYAQRVREACETGKHNEVTRLLISAWMPYSSVKPYLDGLALALRREGHGAASVAHRARGVLDDAIEALLITRPLHWTLLAKAQIVEDTSIATMAVGLTRRGVLFLFYSPSFVASITQEELQGVLCHEIYHVIFGHLDPPTLESDHERTAWTLACEASANEYVPFPLPGEPITIQSLGLPPNESTYDRYHRLLQTSFGTCRQMDMILGTLNEAPGHHGDLESGRSVSADSLLESAAEELQGVVDEATTKAIGRHPGKWAERLTPDRLGSLRWDALLRLRASALLRRYSTLKFPSRRFPELVGIVSGRRSKREKPTVLAAIDTSGSMSTSELNQVSTELFALVRMRLRVACIQCDAGIREERWLKQGEQVTRVHGRGGTDLRPPFGKDVLRKYKPDLLVYFTDGYGATPASAPPGVEVLWVLTGEKPRVPAPWGTSVCLRPRRQRHMVLGPGT